MYVCICKGITEKQLIDAISTRQGSGTKEILKALGVGSDCGTCIEDAVKSALTNSQNTKNNVRLNDQSNKS